MTSQKTFKRRVRDRMAKTGESYTAARRQLIDRGVLPDPGTPTYETVVSDEAMRAATGRTHDEWFPLVDSQGGVGLAHGDIVRWLMAEHGVQGWWAQSITVSYERARGRRAKGQRIDGGWSATASKTVAVSAERAFDAFEELDLREQWLPDADLSLRTATRPRSARYDWEDGSTRVIVWFDAKGPAKATVGIEHERLPDADTAAAMKAYWRERLAALKALLESAEP